METYKAKGMSQFEIKAVATEVRKLLSISDSSKIPILRALEYIVTVLDYELDIVNDSQLLNKYAETYPFEKLIQTLTQDEIVKKYNVSKKVAYIQSTYTPKIPA